ncbi:hypothetical protein HY491_04410 [Candidatus Woesearchaeota archaeon]|nr:hypothetical protein [Candidatus Woesearchaeota archaeon]
MQELVDVINNIHWYSPFWNLSFAAGITFVAYVSNAIAVSEARYHSCKVVRGEERAEREGNRFLRDGFFHPIASYRHFNEEREEYLRQTATLPERGVQ